MSNTFFFIHYLYYVKKNYYNVELFPDKLIYLKKSTVLMKMDRIAEVHL
jgi:hypothetical protein